MNDNKLGNVICKLRKEKGITQKDLANALNVSDKAISRWELGNSSPNLEMIFQISRFFNVSFNDLLTARVDTNNPDDKIVCDIIEEFSNMSKKNRKRIKYILIFSVILSIILAVAMIFTNSYNRFKVYKVYSENNGITPIYGFYVETNIRDFIYFGDIKIKNLNIDDESTVSLDIYVMENNEEKIIQTYSSLEKIYLVGSQSYIEIDNFSDYFDNMYLRVKIIDSKNNVQEYTAKLEFTLDFSNNKIYYEDNFNIEKLNYEVPSYNEKNIKDILLANGFEKINNNVLNKNEENNIIRYFNDPKIIIYYYENNNLNYQYSYHLQSNILEVLVVDENSTEISNYKYDVTNNKMECKVGSCNDYKTVLKILEDKVLYLLH